MLVEFDGGEYEFDLEEIDIMQALKIQAVTGLTLLGLERGLEDGDPNALRSVYWLMLQNSGLKTPLEGIANFKVVKFAMAMSEANEREAERKREEEKAELAAAAREKRAAKKAATNPT